MIGLAYHTPARDIDELFQRQCLCPSIDLWTNLFTLIGIYRYSEMPKFNRRRSHSRKTNMKLKPPSNSLFATSNDDSTFEDEPEQLYSSEEGKTFDFTPKEMLDNIAVLYTLCAETVDNKYLSTLLYITLRHLGYSWRDVDSFLGTIGAMTAKTCHNHSKTFLSEDIDHFCAEERGGKQRASFYDLYPELEELARVFSIEGCSRKESSFTAKELAEYIDEQYYILTGEKKENHSLVRSIQSVHLDLRRWGIHYSANKIRPYWIGHEREDVVQHRERVVDYFLSRETDYYTVSQGADPKWIVPVSPKPVILLCELGFLTFEQSEGLLFSYRRS